MVLIMKKIMIMMITLYDVGIVAVVDDDDDDVVDVDVDVEGTRPGPYAVRSDLEHQVKHKAKISHFYQVFSLYEEGGPTGEGETKCLATIIHQFSILIPLYHNPLYW